MKASVLLREQFVSCNPPRSLFPLLWLHGTPEETEETLRREIRTMEEAGCGGFVIESRPHADYLGDGWWREAGDPGAWTVRVIGVKPSWSGRMFDKMVDYLCPEVTDCFIELTYETTKRRFPEY